MGSVGVSEGDSVLGDDVDVGLVDAAVIVGEPVVACRGEVFECCGEEAGHLPASHWVERALDVRCAAFGDSGRDQSLDRELVDAAVMIGECPARWQRLGACADDGLRCRSGREAPSRTSVRRLVEDGGHLELENSHGLVGLRE